MKALSGGERNRLLLARLFTHEANVLVLDEPTNDLDVETLELLETILLEFRDGLRATTVSSSTRRRAPSRLTRMAKFVRTSAAMTTGESTNPCRGNREATPKKSAPKANSPTERPRKLSYRENEELAAIPAQIEELEAQKDNLEEALSDPELYRDGPEKAAPLQARLAEAESNLEALYLRWEELESIRENFEQAQS